jgi:hypothetical protein
MKKSPQVTLTIVAAVSLGAAKADSRPDPCAAAMFNEQACQAAIQNRGYCLEDRWVPMRYSYPYPYYYDQYQVHALLVGPATPFEAGTCEHRHIGGAHGVVAGTAARGGFGAHGCAAHAGA